jgi:polysaccharide export outer membrane protein
VRASRESVWALFLTKDDNMFERLAKIVVLSALVSVLHADEASIGFADRNARYRLQPNDVVEIHYRYTPEFDQTVSIQPDGFVSVKLIGEVKLGGLSLDGVKTLLVEKSSARLRDPEISLVLKEFEKPHFVVAGEVANPGRFEIRGTISALEAVAMAGGLKSSAKQSQAILYRKVSSETAETRVVNLKRIATVAGMPEDIELRSGDLLFVPQSRISKIERFVKWGSFGIYANPVLR